MRRRPDPRPALGLFERTDAEWIALGLAHPFADDEPYPDPDLMLRLTTLNAADAFTAEEIAALRTRARRRRVPALAGISPVMARRFLIEPPDGLRLLRKGDRDR